MKHFISIILLACSFIGAAQENTELSKLIKEIEQVDSTFDIENPIYSGKHTKKFEFQTIEQEANKAGKYEAILVRLEAIPENSLTTQAQINRQIKILQLRYDVNRVKYRINLIPMNAEGGFYNRPIFFLPNLPFNTVEDYRKYLSWLPTFADYIQYNLQLMKQGAKEGILPPKIIVENNLKLMKGWTESDVEQHPFFLPALTFPASITPADQQIIREDLNKILSETILPAYQELEKYTAGKYLKTSPEKVGISQIKGGKAYYETLIRHYTTQDMTPDSVFQTGMVEVSRIRAQMESIIQQVGFEGSFAEFIAFLRTDPQFYPTTPEELLYKAAWLSKKAEAKLPVLFSKLYELPFTVAPVPADIAPNYTGGRYVSGDRKLNKPGTYWVNTYDLKSRPFYTLPALTVHEAVPGHHLQIMMAAELEGLPEFRKNYYISAFGEGWGLYSEYLGEEMGMYTTPYELFGRYTYEMWRACRLVVDVGIHYKGWNREQAMDFLSGNTALSLHEVTTEIDRYIGWPGQAVSYKTGELMIKKLRAKAEQKLGPDFDIQEFHKTLLKNGSVPLPVLEKEVNQYIIETKK